LFLWARLESRWSDRLWSENTLWRSDVQRIRDITEIDPADTSSDLFDQRDLDVLGFRSDWQWRQSDSWIFGFGAEVENHNVDYDYQLVSTTNPILFPGQPPIARQTLKNVEGETFAVYASARRIFGRLTAELGWRWDAERYTGLDENTSSPRLGIQYEIGERTRLTASWGYYYQFQRPEALQVEDGVDQFSPAIRAEHRIVGIDHQLRKSLMLSGAVYQKLYRPARSYYTNLYDRLEVIPEARADRILVNASSAEARGLELSMKYRSDAVMSWWANYALTYAEDRVDGSDVARNWDQRHAINLVTNWRGERWNFNVAARWRSGWPRTLASLGNVDTPIGPQLGIVPGERNAANFDDYSRVDIRLSRDVQLRRSDITYYFEVYNLFDTQNTCCVDHFSILPGPTLQVEEELWGEVLPSLGFIWTFH
jgi:outer membrane receptor for ferrienterochelin and colicin